MSQSDFVSNTVCSQGCLCTPLERQSAHVLLRTKSLGFPQGVSQVFLWEQMRWETFVAKSLSSPTKQSVSATCSSFKDGKRDHEPMNTGILQKLGKARKRILPWVQKEQSPVDTLILVKWDPFWTSVAQNCKIIYLCCLKPKSLWWFVISSIRKMMLINLKQGEKNNN